MSNESNEIFTQRLLLRKWQESDLTPFAELNSDARVMEFFPQRLDRVESDQMVQRIRAHFEEHGFGLWAVEVLGPETFIGFVGLYIPKIEAHFTPCVEVGWRLAHSTWGKGYATEAAAAALSFGFGTLRLTEIVAMTTVGNLKSRRVMEKLGMTYSAEDDFEHPKVPEGNPLRPHVLYRIGRKDPFTLRKQNRPNGRAGRGNDSGSRSGPPRAG